MPVEGQWIRVRTPLGRRDRRVLAGAGLAAVIAIGGASYAYVDRADGDSNADCIAVTFPSTMGGATLRRCGAAAAARLCLSNVTIDERVAAECRRKGYEVSPPGLRTSDG